MAHQWDKDDWDGQEIMLCPYMQSGDIERQMDGFAEEEYKKESCDRHNAYGNCELTDKPCELAKFRITKVS